MKRLLSSTLLVIACTTLFTTAHAQETSQGTDSHKDHQTEASTQNEKKEHMMGMMHECAKSHKDGKMCQHEMMEKCESEMTKDECAKMMKEMKNKHKPMIKK